METEQPIAEVENNQDGGSGISDILTNGLKETADSPEVVSQTDEGDPDNQPSAKTEQEKEQEELFGELLLEDEKKMSFKSKEDLANFIERNKDLFGKTDHFLRMSDYTRKTQALKQEREQFDESKKQYEDGWGEVRPDDASMGAFKNLWAVFQNGGQEFQQKINSFIQDVNLLAEGKHPVGPLNDQSEGGQPSSISPEVISLRRELAMLKKDITEGNTRATTERQAEYQKKAESDWAAWRQAKEQEGTKVSEDLETAMVPYLQGMASSEMDNKSKLDRAFKLAADELGLDGKQAVKKVIADAKKSASRSPSSPSFKTPVNQVPVEKSVGGILRQGLDQI